MQVLANTNELFASIENNLSSSKKSLKLPEVLQVIDFEGISLLPNLNSSSSIYDIKSACDDVASLCKKKWMEEVPNLINKIGNRLDEEEKKRIKEQKDAELRALLEAQTEEEAKKKKIKKYLIYAIAIIAIFLFGFFYKDDDTPGGMVGGISGVLGLLMWYFIIKWFIKRSKKNDQ